MKCYQCHKEMGRNRYPMIYCRQPFCEKCGRVREAEQDYRVYVDGKCVGRWKQYRGRLAMFKIPGVWFSVTLATDEWGREVG